MHYTNPHEPLSKTIKLNLIKNPASIVDKARSAFCTV